MSAADYICQRIAINGRVAIFLRQDKDSPWVQVESALSQNGSADYAATYDIEDAEVRRSLIAESIEDGEDWGDDAPSEHPVTGSLT